MDLFAHFFFPENDLALGRDIANYTAPRAAVGLRASGELLPVWFMEPEDCVVAEGADAEWLEQQRVRFGMPARLYDGCPASWMARPWGWSRASRRFFERLGFACDELPSDERLEAIRNLSHRRRALHIAERLVAAGLNDTPVGRECSDVGEVEDYVREVGDAVVKLPWSSTGRGIVMLSAEEFGTFRRQIGGMIVNQGSVCCEPRVRGLQDLAMLFTIEGGAVRYDGLSVFRSAASGSYEGNILAPQSVLEQMCCGLLRSDALDQAKAALPRILEDVIGNAYEGPFGVDMLIYESAAGEPALDGCIELNLRNTMGHVAQQFYRRYCAESFRGMFRVDRLRPADTSVVENGRLVGGTLCLNPPGNPFHFVAESGPDLF